MFSKISFLWLPVFDKYRYKPLGIHPEFLQNSLDILFLLVFIWFWSWGPLLVILYYVVETLVMSFFTSLKLWKSNVQLSLCFSNCTVKLLIIMVLFLVVCIFSFGQIKTFYDLLGKLMALPSLKNIVFGDSNFLLGVVAIIVQQTIEYIKYQRLAKEGNSEWVTHIVTPFSRIFIQQLSIMLGILSVVIVSLYDIKRATLMIALILGLIKLVFGQFYVIPARK